MSFDAFFYAAADSSSQEGAEDAERETHRSESPRTSNGRGCVRNGGDGDRCRCRLARPRRAAAPLGAAQHAAHPRRGAGPAVGRPRARPAVGGPTDRDGDVLDAVHRRWQQSGLAGRRPMVCTRWAGGSTGRHPARDHCGFVAVGDGTRVRGDVLDHGDRGRHSHQPDRCARPGRCRRQCETRCRNIGFVHAGCPPPRMGAAQTGADRSTRSRVRTASHGQTCSRRLRRGGGPSRRHALVDRGRAPRSARRCAGDRGRMAAVVCRQPAVIGDDPDLLCIGTRLRSPDHALEGSGPR